VAKVNKTENEKNITGYNPSLMARPANTPNIWRKPWVYLAILAALAMLAVGLYQIPSIHARAYYHLATFRAKIFYFFNPPTENVFNPIGNQNPTSIEVAQTPTSVPTATAVPGPTATPLVPPTATAVPTPLPDSVMLGKITLQPQTFNNCGPATLSMNLEYWGWDGHQGLIQELIKPRLEDLAVMPAELQIYVEEHTDFKMIVRRAGELEMIKELVSVGIPVMIERGYFIVSDGWMGHFGVINGYDDATQTVHIPDSFSGVIEMSYDMLQGFWDEFNNTYLIVYPPEREAEVMAILGADADLTYNQQHALERAEARLATTTGKPQFFAAYSKGIVLNELKRYAEAAAAFDQAFALYAKLNPDDRPWRMIWYEPGPYEAYYHTERYQDVINLADKTLEATPNKGLPETYLWRGRADLKLGNQRIAIFDFKRALQWHPNWPLALAELKALGVEP
jgi:tetratricopeptide (TPR) repeat protein